MTDTSLTDEITNVNPSPLGDLLATGIEVGMSAGSAEMIVAMLEHLRQLELREPLLRYYSDPRIAAQAAYGLAIGLMRRYLMARMQEVAG